MDAYLSKTLRASRANLVEQNRAVLAQIDAETDAAKVKDLETQWDKRDDDIEALTAKIERAEKQEKLETEQAQPLRRTQVGRVLPSNASPEQRAEVEARYKRAYWDNLRGFTLEADDMALLASRRRTIRGEAYDLEGRAQSIVPATAGGFAVPQGFVNTLEKNMVGFGGVRPMATILRTSKGNRLPWPTVNDTGNEAVIIAEGVASTPADAAFSEVVFGAFTFRSTILASFELLQDEDVNLEGWILDAISERFARGSNRKYTVGVGTTEPKGFVTSSSLGATSATAGSITYDNIIELEHSIDPAYRTLPGVGFQLHDNALKFIKKLVDTTGQPIWLNGIAAREPNTIMGYPYAINQHMASPIAASKSVCFGAFKKFVIRDVQDLLIVRANELHLANGQVGFYAFFRTDSQMLDAGTDPVKHMAQGA